MNHAPPFARANATGGTSQAAAEMARPSAGKLRTRLILKLEAGPATPEELQAQLAADGTPTLLTTVRARVCDLRRDGLVVDAGSRGLGESRRAKVIRWRLATLEERQAVLHGEASR